MNKLIITGNITGEIQIKTNSNDNKYASFSIANNRKIGGKDNTLFLNVRMWGKRAEVVHAHFKKGDPILLEGAIQSFKNKEGTVLYYLEADGFEFFSVRKDSTSTTKAPTTTGNTAAEVADDEIPF